VPNKGFISCQNCHKIIILVPIKGLFFFLMKVQNIFSQKTNISFHSLFPKNNQLPKLMHCLFHWIGWIIFRNFKPCWEREPLCDMEEMLEWLILCNSS
jgi:hypothetical protein